MGVRVRQKVKGKGNPWWVFVSHNGQRMSRSVGTKKAALSAAKEIEQHLGLGKFGIEKPKAKPTFGEYAQKWLDFVASQTRGSEPVYKKSTLEEHKCILRVHALPAFDEHEIQSVSKGDIRDFMVSKIGKLSTGRVITIKGVMSNIFNLAIEDEVIDINPTIGISKRLFSKNGKRKAIEKTEVFTEDEIDLFLNTCEKHFREFYPFFITAIRTGMRLGELLALEWGDIDFNSKYIWIGRSYRRGRITKTKTNQARQTDMSDQLVIALRDHLRVCKENALKQGRGEVSGLVFNWDQVYKGKFIRRQYRRILKKAGLRYVKFHGLRHAFCAHLLSKGISPYYVSKQAGHSSINITCDIYGTWIRGDDNRHVNALDSQHQNDPYMHPEGIQNKQLIDIVGKSMG